MAFSDYHITLDDDGSGNITPTVRRGGTAASGGTALTLPSGELFPGSTTTKLIGLAVTACLRAIQNDKAAGN